MTNPILWHRLEEIGSSRSGVPVAVNGTCLYLNWQTAFSGAPETVSCLRRVQRKTWRTSHSRHWSAALMSETSCAITGYLPPYVADAQGRLLTCKMKPLPEVPGSEGGCVAGSVGYFLGGNSW